MIQYAVPSRGRSRTIRERTLAVMERAGVPSEQITVFADPAETDDYAQELEGTGIRLETGEHGVTPQRNRIFDYYEEGQLVVQIDDDIRELMVRDGPQEAHPITATEWAEIMDVGFRWCRRSGARLWGIYPVYNPMFMRDRVRTDLTYICANFWGYFSPGAGKPSPLRATLEDKEDYERSLQCYEADGAVVRLEWLAPITRYYDEPGGMQADGLRTEERIRASAEELVRRFPQYAAMNMSKRSGHAEIRMRSGPTAAAPR